MLGVANLITGLALCCLKPSWRFQFSIESILSAMGFVGDDDDVLAQGQHREAVFINPWHELLNSGKYNTATRSVGQLGAQVTS
ncbi:hypothetical protein D3C80_1715860 [compost metagenome]